MKSVLKSIILAVALLVGLGQTIVTAGETVSSLAVLDGSCIAPSVTFVNSTGTGFYRAGADIIGICVNGVEVGRFTSSGLQSAGQVAVSSAAQTGTGSFQSGSFDTNVSGTPGHEGGFVAGVMGNVLGAVTGSGNSVFAGTIGNYTLTGANSSTYAKGATIGMVGDGTTSADGAVVAVLGGDLANSGVTTARAAFTVDYENSALASGFTYGLDLAGPGAHNGYPAAFYRTADVRLANGLTVKSVTTAITAGTGCSDTAGSLTVTTHATGRATLWICNGTTYQKSA